MDIGAYYAQFSRGWIDKDVAVAQSSQASTALLYIMIGWCIRKRMVFVGSREHAVGNFLVNYAD